LYYIYLRGSGSVFCKGEEYKGGIECKEGDMIRFEIDEESNPRTLRLFVNRIQQPFVLKSNNIGCLAV